MASFKNMKTNNMSRKMCLDNTINNSLRFLGVLTLDLLLAYAINSFRVIIYEKRK